MQRLNSEPQPLIDDYLARLRQNLHEVPTNELDQLLEQARAEIELQLHLDRALESDAPTTEEVLRHLGEPDVLAKRLRSQAAGGTSRLTACRSCLREVSVDALTCPHCGAPHPAQKNWRGRGYEWKSKQTLWGWPLVHIAVGRNEKGKLRVAKGIIAIGQFAIGAITIAQFGVGALFGFGQFVLAPIAIGQFGIGLLFGLGQFATGAVAIGQIAFGNWVRAMVGVGAHVWSVTQHDASAVEFFRRLMGR